MAETLGLQAMTLDEVNQANAGLMTLLENPDPEVELGIANSLWGRQGITFDTDFLQRSTDYYDAEVRSLDFASSMSADTINRWVSVQTRGRIRHIVDHSEIDEIIDAVLLLINALYFKGEWTLPFDEDQTQDGQFTLLDDTQKTLPMMRCTDEFQYLENDQFQAVSLAYGDEYLRMLIFLPKAGTTLMDFRASLTNENWDVWLGQFGNREGTVVLPRFRADYLASLNDALTALGMGVAFAPGADLSGMGQPFLFIKDVKHRTLLDVNEEGTEAAAVTAVRVAPGASPRPALPPFTIIVDHPFFLAIQDRPTRAILFIGSIVDPQ